NPSTSAIKRSELRINEIRSLKDAKKHDVVENRHGCANCNKTDGAQLCQNMRPGENQIVDGKQQSNVHPKKKNFKVRWQAERHQHPVIQAAKVRHARYNGESVGKRAGAKQGATHKDNGIRPNEPCRSEQKSSARRFCNAMPRACTREKCTS